MTLCADTYSNSLFSTYLTYNMEPISTTIILSALVAGATAALQDTVADEIKHLYNHLKTSIINRYGNKVPISSLESLPTSKNEVEKKLKEAEAEKGSDKQIVEQSQSLLNKINEVRPQVFDDAEIGITNVRGMLGVDISKIRTSQGGLLVDRVESSGGSVSISDIQTGIHRKNSPNE